VPSDVVLDVGLLTLLLGAHVQNAAAILKSRGCFRAGGNNFIDATSRTLVL
jgi:hypothetical protein